MQINASILTFKVGKSQSEVDGAVALDIVSYKRLPAQEEVVGMQTFWNANSQAINLSATFIIKKRLYERESYLLHKDTLYEIFTPAKAATLDEIKLNCREVADEELKQKAKGFYENES